MTSQTKNDLKKIKDAINMLARPDRKTQLTTRVGDNAMALDAAITLIEDLCQVIRQQERLIKTVETEAGDFEIRQFMVDEDGEPVAELAC